MPYASADDLREMHFSCDDAVPTSLNTLRVNVKSESPVFLTTLMPEKIVTKSKSAPHANTHILKIEDCPNQQLKPRQVYHFPPKPNVTDIQYFPKQNYVDQLHADHASENEEEEERSNPTLSP